MCCEHLSSSHLSVTFPYCETIYARTAITPSAALHYAEQHTQGAYPCTHAPMRRLTARREWDFDRHRVRRTALSNIINRKRPRSVHLFIYPFSFLSKSVRSLRPAVSGRVSQRKLPQQEHDRDCTVKHDQQLYGGCLTSKRLSTSVNNSCGRN